MSCMWRLIELESIWGMLDGGVSMGIGPMEAGAMGRLGFVVLIPRDLEPERWNGLYFALWILAMQYDSDADTDMGSMCMLGAVGTGVTKMYVCVCLYVALSCYSWHSQLGLAGLHRSEAMSPGTCETGGTLLGECLGHTV